MPTATRVTSMTVYAFGRPVGTLAQADDVVAFEYSDEWLRSGFSVSPLSLPLRKQVFLPRSYRPFEGLFGVFSDSLPDGWGRLLLDRLLRRMGQDPDSYGPLDRLALVGDGGMGALEYVPDLRDGATSETTDFDSMAQAARKIYDDEYSEGLDMLYHLGGSSGGARPKILVDLHGEPWIVKFHTTREGPNAGLMEYRYALCARDCGLNVAAVDLLPSEECAGYFAVRRFDRRSLPDGTTEKVHMVSASALLETSHRVPNLDYVQIMKLAMALTNDYSQLESLFRLMCFNVFAHNRDDHSKNFSFLHEADSGWHVAPAYDLTYSNSIGGEHATTVDGNGADPGLPDILRVAQKMDIDASWAAETAVSIESIVQEQLGDYLR